MSLNNTEVTTNHFGFLLIPDYSMIAFSSAIEPLRMANQVAHKPLYRWTVYTLDGKPVKASNGLEITPDASLENAGEMSTFFICG